MLEKNAQNNQISNILAGSNFLPAKVEPLLSTKRLNIQSDSNQSI